MQPIFDGQPVILKTFFSPLPFDGNRGGSEGRDSRITERASYNGSVQGAHPNESVSFNYAFARYIAPSGISVILTTYILCIRQ